MNGVAERDELALWAAVKAGEMPRDAAVRLGIPAKRVEYLCNKWASRGIYEYGVSHDLGWALNAERIANDRQFREKMGYKALSYVEPKGATP